MNSPISELLQKARKPLLSYEFFPPKDEPGMAALARTAEKLLAARPDFVTVTYGAGGSTRERTFQVCEQLQKMGFDPIMPHLTCVGSSRPELERIADEIYGRGFRNIMALRGDPPQGETVFRPPADGLAHASDLVVLLKRRHAEFCCGVAGYPERHPEAPGMESDIAQLKAKVDAGASFVTTQLFFDNRFYFEFVKRCRAAGIDRPILPGLLPAISLKQAQRMTARCNTSLPAELATEMERAGGEGDAAEAVGVRWAVKQIRDLIAHGAPGVHLYVLNRAKAALAPELIGCFR